MASHPIKKKIKLYTRGSTVLAIAIDKTSPRLAVCQDGLLRMERHQEAGHSDLWRGRRGQEERDQISNVIRNHSFLPSMSPLSDHQYRFEEFLKYVLELGSDPHFRPQHLACPFCEVNFTLYR